MHLLLSVYLFMHSFCSNNAIMVQGYYTEETSLTLICKINSHILFLCPVIAPLRLLNNWMPFSVLAETAALYSFRVGCFKQMASAFHFQHALSAINRPTHVPRFSPPLIYSVHHTSCAALLFFSKVKYFNLPNESMKELVQACKLI